MRRFPPPWTWRIEMFLMVAREGQLVPKTLAPKQAPAAPVAGPSAAPAAAGARIATALNPMGKVALVGANFSALVHYWQEKIDKAANATRQSLGAAYAHQGRSPR